jgi:hypothetical protein
MCELLNCCWKTSIAKKSGQVLVRTLRQSTPIFSRVLPPYVRRSGINSRQRLLTARKLRVLLLHLLLQLRDDRGGNRIMHSRQRRLRSKIHLSP